MDEPAHALAYASADFSEPNSFFVELFAALGLGCTRAHVIDLGCGPADIPIRIAMRWPRLEVTAADASLPMLALARERVRKARLEHRVGLVATRLPQSAFATHSCEAVVSNSMLHHLPEPLFLWREALRIVRPGGAILVMDLLRPCSEEAAVGIVERHGAGEPEVLRRDFYNSLLASFTIEEVVGQLVRAGARLEVRQVSDRHWAAVGKP